jgi:hypothetical protein
MTGLEPVFGRGHVFAKFHARLPRTANSRLPRDSNTHR